MKKIFRILAVALIAVSLLTLGSCSGKGALKKILNDGYEPSYTVLKNSSQVYDLTDFTYETDNGYLALFSTYNSGATTYKIYSFAENRVIATYGTTDTTKYTIDLLSGISGYRLKTVRYNGTGWLQTVAETTYKLCNAVGDSMMETNDSYDPYFISEDLFRYKDTIYQLDGQKNFCKKMDIASYMYVPSITDAYGDYYYNIDSNSVTVYDNSLNTIHYWEAPQYVNDMIAFVLNNGNVFIQYTYKADNLEKKYDYLDNNGDKLFIKQHLLKIKNGKVSNIKAKYYVSDVITAQSMLNMFEGAYKDKFENIALAYKINDQRLSGNGELFLMKKNGKLGKSLMAIDNQSAFPPIPIAKDRFAVNLKTGDRAIIDSKCNVIATIGGGSFIGNPTTSRDITITAGYIFTPGGAIYDTSLNLVYDLEANNAEILGLVGNTIFVKKNSDAANYSIMAITGSSTKTIISIGIDSGTSFKVLENIGYSISYSNNTASATYFTPDGNAIASPGYTLTEVCRADDNSVVIFRGTNTNGSTIYHRFSK